ncbi:acyltransferase [Photobacterium sp. BZF1]|uniref:acyltransferase family protein n=1 Tax=Photobacterium sp. BZF1 TaxID=1904457 RepID=UPI001653ECA2|nr:acyltransferase family protein [Photobacterium sp. BZF1]MBC7002130.1 acyltransferase [Photobacterium sp. BZF1]
MLSYRKELDGLRALAVIAVIIYHANLEVFGFHILKGGFFGVDVFLVLSGYLITGIIRNQMEKGSFSFVDFYWRRAKRILPALLIMLVVSTLLAYVILLPNDLVSYSKSLQSALFFGSNHFFYGEDSYVADASIYKPLLHTWSLAVEWQFYIVYPIVVWFINKYFKRHLFGILLGLAILSLQYSNYIVSNYPDMAFFLLPSRAWELILGGLITFYDRELIQKATKNSFANFAYQALPIIGLAVVIHCMVFIDHTVLHPSFLTLLPVLGTCLFIMFSHEGELTNDILSLKPVVYIGLISYSLYLWHQPVFVFFRFVKNESFRHEHLLLLIAISSLLAVVTYKYIESYYRQKKTSHLAASLLVIQTGLLMVFAYQTPISKGFPERLTGIVKEAYDMYETVEFRRLKDTQLLGETYRKPSTKQAQCNFRTVDTSCQFGDGDWITLGDSFAGQYDYALKEMTTENHEGMRSLTYEQCPFVSPSIWFGNVPECTVVNEERLDFINSLSSPKKIIVAANYEQFFHPKKRTADPLEDGKRNFQGGEFINSEEAWTSYANNINKLLELGHEVFVIYATPRPDIDVKNLVFQQLKSNTSAYEDTWSAGTHAFEQASKVSKKLDSYLTEHPRLHKVLPADFLCEGTHCKVIDSEGGLYNNGGHLSYVGAKKVLRGIFGKS